VSEVVLWKKGHSAGVRFDHPLHEAVVCFLGYEKASMPLDWGMATNKFWWVLPVPPEESE